MSKLMNPKCRKCEFWYKKSYSTTCRYCKYLHKLVDNFNNKIQTESIQNLLNTNKSFKPLTIPRTEEEIINNCKLLNLRETAQ